jgi:radical SAM-linked protein
MAYSAGFTPHPKVSYANAAPTGAASEAEYLEIQVAERCDPVALRAALDEALPPGLDVVDVVEAGPGAFADRLVASEWEIVLPGAALADVDAAVATFLAAQEVRVERLTKSGRREFDARGPVVSLRSVSGGDAASDLGRASVASGAQCAILHLVVRHATPAVRPDDVLAALHVVADLAPPSPPQVTRLAQGPLDEVAGSVSDPLTPDRDGADA